MGAQGLNHLIILMKYHIHIVYDWIRWFLIAAKKPIEPIIFTNKFGAQESK